MFKLYLIDVIDNREYSERVERNQRLRLTRYLLHKAISHLVSPSTHKIDTLPLPSFGWEGAQKKFSTVVNTIPSPAQDYIYFYKCSWGMKSTTKPKYTRNGFANGYQNWSCPSIIRWDKYYAHSQYTTAKKGKNQGFNPSNLMVNLYLKQKL